MTEFLREQALLLLLIAGTMFTCCWLLRHRKHLRITPLTALILSMLHTLTGVGCVKVFAVLEGLDFSSIGSMSLFGAVFFLPAVYWLGAKISGRSIPQVFDIFTPCMVFTLLCARVNCVFVGCCLGRYIPVLAPLRWPTRQAEILFYVLLLRYFWKEDRKASFLGLNYPIYMIAYGAFRFLTEGFRQSDSPLIIHISHVWAAVTFALGLSIYYEIKNKCSNTRSRRKNRA